MKELVEFCLELVMKRNVFVGWTVGQEIIAIEFNTNLSYKNLFLWDFIDKNICNVILRDNEKKSGCCSPTYEHGLKWFKVVVLQPPCCLSLPPDFVISSAKHIFHLHWTHRDETDNQSPHLTLGKKKQTALFPKMSEKNRNSCRLRKWE